LRGAGLPPTIGRSDGNGSSFAKGDRLVEIRRLWVEHVSRVGHDDPGSRILEHFREALAHRGLALLVVRTLCDIE
jgi:hypothetical protein